MLKLTTMAAILFATGVTNASPQAHQNPNYVKYPELSLIQRNLSGLDRVYQQNYQKFISYKVPNGGEVLLVATDGMSDEQMLRAYNILDFYLTDVPGSKYGADKSVVANAMASNGAVLVLPGGADGDSPVSERALAGQPLYALEFPIEGSKAYVENDYRQRDAGFEEIFHLVHDYGIGTKYTNGPLKTTYQAEITHAMENGLTNTLWANGFGDIVKEWEAEGSLEQEYIISVFDSYFGYWGAWNEAPGGMWGGYVAKTRADVKAKDPLGAALVGNFLSDDVTYMARIDPRFSGIFKMRFDANEQYTHKSQYLVNARLLGDLPSDLMANGRDNILIGNQADNLIDGAEGHDIVQYPLASTDVTITRSKDGLIVSGAGTGTDHLQNIEVLRFTDQDIQVGKN